jgi:hypothetical protein
MNAKKKYMWKDLGEWVYFQIFITFMSVYGYTYICWQSAVSFFWEYLIKDWLWTCINSSI